MLKRHVVVLLPDADGRLALRGAYPPEDTLDEADLAAAQWCAQSNRPTGHGADTLPGAKWLFVPLRTGAGPIAVVGIDGTATPPLLTPDQRRLLDALGDQAAVSIERIALAEAVDHARLVAETERLRNAMLTSISHDLRTPLAAILGAGLTTLFAVPLVMLSGVAAETGRRFDGEAEGLRAWSGLSQFIDKPVTGRQLLRVVEERAGAGHTAGADLEPAAGATPTAGRA